MPFIYYNEQLPDGTVPLYDAVWKLKAVTFDWEKGEWKDPEEGTEGEVRSWKVCMAFFDGPYEATCEVFQKLLLLKELGHQLSGYVLLPWRVHGSKVETGILWARHDFMSGAPGAPPWFEEDVLEENGPADLGELIQVGKVMES